ncbi:MAG: hypothetical protein N2316_11660 [Spirochaetes bacterium]|nr:hypothetical protein [Spirochaetota bacterium]
MRNSFLHIIVSACVFSFSCITLDVPRTGSAHTKNAFVFPPPSNVGWVYRKLENYYSKEKAEAVIVNLQPYLYQYRSEKALAKAVEVRLEHEAVKIAWGMG